MDNLQHMTDLASGSGAVSLTDLSAWVHYAVVLLAATASGLLLAYHPVYRGRGLSLEGLEQRKTMIVYAVVGALIAAICTTNPAMAFVIFGIGGLMRFRTDLGASKSTGYTIIATLIGLCWGLRLDLVALLATLYVWILIYALERAPVRQLAVGGIDMTAMSRSADAYREAIIRAGARLLSHSKDFKRLQMIFFFRLPRGVNFEQVTREVATIPDDLRGTPDWQE